MNKKDHFNIMMAGLISGIVAITTATLGISGTVIGSVLSSILYQILSSYSEKKLEGTNLDNFKYKSKKPSYGVDIGGEIVYLLPILVMFLIEVVFLFSSFLYPLAKLFNLLEYATDQNLFRVMGLGLILLSFYPFLKSNAIKRNTAILTFLTGIIFIFRGFVDSGFLLFRVTAIIFSYFDFFIGLFILFLLLIIIIQVLGAIYNSQNNFHKLDVSNSFNDGEININNNGLVSENKNDVSSKSANASNKTEYFFKDKFNK